MYKPVSRSNLQNLVSVRILILGGDEQTRHSLIVAVSMRGIKRSRLEVVRWNYRTR